MGSRILVFFPYNPFPPHHGAHKRCVEILVALRSLGHDVHFASSVHTSFDSWDDAGRTLLDEELARSVSVHRYSPRVHRGWQYTLGAAWLLGRFGGPEIVLTRPPGLARWFASVLERTAPDVILMNYAEWDYLIPDHVRKSILKIMETHDLVSVNRQMQRAIQVYLGPPGLPVVLSNRTANDELVREDFFRTRQFPVDARELRTFDRYDHTIAISEQEKQLIEQSCPHTRTHFIPMTVRPASGRSTYSGPALFPLGPNLFNVQGYLYFVRRVLPRVLKAAPSFHLRVTGTFAYKVTAEAQPGIEWCGFVRDFGAITAQSGFVVCPVFGGTGQQVKIVEAMSRGLAVVALRDAAERTPLVHGVSGLVADSAEEFAEHVLTLWNDRALCRSLGEAGRRVVEMHLGEERLLASLQALLP